MPQAPDASPPAGLIVALLGAESTGKSTLAPALAQEIARITGWSCTWVPEALRSWCDQRQRTPRREEQAGIAAEQARQIEAAARSHDVVIADTTPLMTAVYHHTVFDDGAMDLAALAWQRRCAITLVTALDLPWVADGVQRDGPHVREAVDNTLRQLLMNSGQAFTVVAGLHGARLEAALNAVTPALRQHPAPHAGLLSRLKAREAAQPRWRALCADCDDPDCEHALRRLTPDTPPRA